MNLRAHLVCLAALGAAQAHASPITLVDQQQTAVNNGSNNSGAQGLAARKGQSFTPTLPGVDAVEIYLDGNGIADGVQEQFLVNIRNTDLSGAILGTSSVTTLPDAFGGGLVHFDFPAVVPLTPGNVYAIELVPVTLGVSNVFTVRLGLSNPYPGGTYFTSPGNPVTADAVFREGLHQAALTTPEPGSLLLLGALAIGAVIGRRWRQVDGA
ncbi:MAG: PEP-CTERM sorting domain-containing protein [Gemmataceae bacterium]